MSNLKSFACPSCNAPLTTTGNDARIRCQFCGNVVIVPPELLTNAARASAPASPSRPAVPGDAPVSAASSGCSGLLVPFIVIGGVIAALVIVGIVVLAGPKGGRKTSSSASSTPVSKPLVSVEVTFGGEGTGAGLFTDPNEFAVDGKGFVYVSDRTTGLIQRFDSEGHYLSQWQADPQAEYGPNCLAADHAGNVFACGDHGLLKFEGATGKLLDTFTDQATNDFFRSSAAALLDGSVLAYESNSDQVVKLDPGGKVLNRTDKISSHLPPRTTTFNVSIAADGLGSSFVLETISGYIMAYKPDGTFINRFGGIGDAQDQFVTVQAIAVDNQSRVYTIDSNQIKLFDPDGHFLTSYPMPDAAKYVSPLGMGFDDAGNLYLLGHDKKIYKLKLPANP